MLAAIALASEVSSPHTTVFECYLSRRVHNYLLLGWLMLRIYDYTLGRAYSLLVLYSMNQRRERTVHEFGVSIIDFAQVIYYSYDL